MLANMRSTNPEMIFAVSLGQNCSSVQIWLNYLLNQAKSRYLSFGTNPIIYVKITYEIKTAIPACGLLFPRIC
jgi:hypothetical protein